jgi:hypothetical protein
MLENSAGSLIKSRNKQIVEIYENDLQVTKSYLSTKFGLSISSIDRILRNAEVVIRREPHGRPNLMNMQALSKGHIWVGAKMDTYLIRHSSMQELSSKIMMSTHQIGLARYGRYDFTLSELQRISSVLGLDLPDHFIEGENTLCQTSSQL